MSETVQVIIATLSGFIIAFFAEPVKTYFQNKARLDNLRTALHRELIHNYLAVSNHLEGTNESGGYDYLYKVLRTECFEYAITSELTFFYQLRESNRLNLLYGSLRMVIASEDDDSYDFFELLGSFVEMVDRAIYNKTLDVKCIQRLVSKEAYAVMINRGKKLMQMEIEKSVFQTS